MSQQTVDDTATTPEFVGDHDIDATTLDIIESTLANTRHEMDRVVETTAISPVIREQSDQFPLIADRKGRMVMGQFGSAIETIIENASFGWDDLEEGDVIATNDPYACAGAVSHTPDMLLLRPIFYEDDQALFEVLRGILEGDERPLPPQTLRKIPAPLDWDEHIENYDALFEEVVGAPVGAD